MQLIEKENLSDIDLEGIPIDKKWDFAERQENKMHRIHTYPAKFPAFITSRAIEDIEKKGLVIKTVGDVFCGCGTVAYESSLYGKDFWGCDINPVAVLIAKAKSHSYKEDRLVRYFNTIQNIANSMPLSDVKARSMNQRIHYWFEDKQIEQLLKIKLAIIQAIPANSKYRYFFLTAFSNILKLTSRWLQKSIKPTIDQNKKSVDVWQSFSKQFDRMKIANKENLQNKGKIKIIIERANFLNKKINNSKIDLLVTSPPYVTSYEYADLHQLSSLWLDYTDDYKALRKGTVGSLYHASDFDKNKSLLNKTGSKIITKLMQVDKNRARNAAKYFVDMQRSIAKSKLLLNKNGYALFVIGNTEYKQVRIDNAKHLIESMFDAGYAEISLAKRKISNKALTPYRTKSGKFTNDKTCRKIYAEEFIVRGIKL